MALIGSNFSGFNTHPGMIPPPGEAMEDNPARAEDVVPADAQPSRIRDEERLFDILKGWFRADATHSAAWRERGRPPDPQCAGPPRYRLQPRPGRRSLTSPSPWRSS